MMGSYGKPCKWCGARLDPGERCDCVGTDQGGLAAMAIEEYRKTFVSVIAVHIPGKDPEPIRFRLPDGRSYHIDHAGKPVRPPRLRLVGMACGMKCA